MSSFNNKDKYRYYDVAPLNKTSQKMTAELQKLYRKIKTKFSEIDKDSDGYIVADEVDTYMKSLDSRWKKADSIVRQFSELLALFCSILTLF